MKQSNEVDKKYDEGKVLLGQMMSDFPRALEAVGWITTYGVQKYNQPGSWRLVEDAISRYDDALVRHDLASRVSSYDEESKYLHLAHRAWNALAILELVLSSGKQLKGVDKNNVK